jgi:nucleoid-associated protein YgaU
MEIVKRLEGSEQEEMNYDFEEHYLHKDEETTKRKKGTLLTIIGLIVIAILGYLGYKNFTTKEMKTVETSTAIVNLPTSSQELVKITPAPPILIKKEIEPIPLKSEVIVPKNIKTVTYTEVLAQELQPVVVMKTLAVKPIAIKEKVKVTPLKKKVIKRIVTKKSKPKIILEKSKIAIVRKGDTLAKISKRFYGSTQEFQRIILANKSIKSHKTSLKIGQKIIIPSNKKSKKQKVSSKKKRIITVKRGDTLNIIAQRFYGNSMKFKGIIRANTKIKSSKTRLKLGQKIIVPYLPKNERRRFVTVKKGYSLAYISKKFYGNIKEVEKIVNANSNIKNKKSTLRIGQKVYVPR